MRTDGMLKRQLHGTKHVAAEHQGDLNERNWESSAQHLAEGTRRLWELAAGPSEFVGVVSVCGKRIVDKSSAVSELRNENPRDHIAVYAHEVRTLSDCWGSLVTYYGATQIAARHEYRRDQVFYEIFGKRVSESDYITFGYRAEMLTAPQEDLSYEFHRFLPEEVMQEVYEPVRAKGLQLCRELLDTATGKLVGSVVRYENWGDYPGFEPKIWQPRASYPDGHGTHVADSDVFLCDGIRGPHPRDRHDIHIGSHKIGKVEKILMPDGRNYRWVHSYMIATSIDENGNMAYKPVPLAAYDQFTKELFSQIPPKEV